MFDNLAKAINESTIDYPQAGLDPLVWRKSNGTWTLRPDTREAILSVLRSYPEIDLTKIADKIRITGSIGSNQWRPDADIDVHVVPKKDSGYWGDEGLLKRVFNWSWQENEKFRGHPVEVFMQYHPDIDLMSMGAYDVLTDTWEAGPSIVPQDYDPYEDYSHLRGTLLDLVQDTDAKFSRLRREIIDYKVLVNAMKSMTPQHRKKFMGKLKIRLQQIEMIINELYKDREEWKAMRRAAGSLTPQKALQDVEAVRKWNDANALFKFIDRYKYMRVIEQLDALLADGHISPDDVDKADKIVKQL